MPTYEYECRSCGAGFDVFQSMSDEPLTVCPSCGKSIRRKINGGTGIIFKGSGFYKNDSRKASDSKSESSGEKADRAGTGEREERARGRRRPSPSGDCGGVPAPRRPRPLAPAPRRGQLPKRTLPEAIAVRGGLMAPAGRRPGRPREAPALLLRRVRPGSAEGRTRLPTLRALLFFRQMPALRLRRQGRRFRPRLPRLRLRRSRQPQPRTDQAARGRGAADTVVGIRRRRPGHLGPVPRAPALPALSQRFVRA